jgi:microcystin-dependent protein
MATGAFFGSCSGSSSSDYIFYIEYTLNSQNITNNTSNITVNQYLHCSGGYNGSVYNGYHTSSWNLNVAGSTVVSVSGGDIDTRNQIYLNLGSWTGDVGHNADGSLSITLSGSFSMGSSQLSGGNVSGTWTLPTIPRASTITTFDNFTIGNNIPVVISRKSVSFTQDIHLYVGGTGVCSRANVPDNYTLVLSSAEQDIIYNAIPNATSAGMVLYCLTYSGGTQIGSTQSKSATASVSSSIVPTFTTVTATETVTNVNTIVGLFVQNLSQIKYDITGAAGVKGSTISSYQITVDGAVYNGISVTTGVLNKSGNITVTGKITDSRGRIATKNVTVNLLAYSMPSITGLTISRANSDGTANPMGTYAKVISTGSTASLINSTQRNNLTYVVYSRVRGTTPWTTKKTLLISGLALSVTDTFSGYTATSSYDFRLDVTDKFNTTISVTVLSTGQVTMSWGNNGVGIGKVWEQGGIDVSGLIYQDGGLVSPSGIINPYAGSSAPAGWLLADGTAVSRTTYAALFAVIGTVYGTGDGSTTFNLPNLKGRIPVGKDSSQTEFDTLGETGGEKTHTLTTSEMPTHNHNTQTTYGGSVYATRGTGVSEINGVQAGISFDQAGSSGGGFLRNGITNPDAGGGSAHNNLQPYIVMNYIIKT